MAKKSYRIDELAEEWDVSPDTVRREIKRGELDAIHIGNTIRVKQESVEEYERKKKLSSGMQG